MKLSDHFPRLERSIFYKSSHMRLNLDTNELSAMPGRFLMQVYLLNDQPPYDLNQKYLAIKVYDGHGDDKNIVSIMDLHHCLNNAINYDLTGSSKLAIPGVEYLPACFKTALKMQFDEVQSIVKNIIYNFEKDNNEPINIIACNLIITKPGEYIEPHVHNNSTKTTLTIGFKFKTLAEYTPSYVEISDNRYSVPDADMFYFVMQDNAVHAAQSSDWIFWWATDFSKTIEDIELNFTKLQQDKP